ncbi:MAG: hypothetical protein U0Q16_15460 [Bryobacteraceae bacterium]
MSSSIDLKVKLAIGVHLDGGQWIACCQALDVATQADTRTAAVDGLREAVELWFESCISRGTLDSALRESGFQSTSDREHVSSTSLETIEVSVPAYVAAAAMSGEACAAR